MVPLQLGKNLMLHNPHRCRRIYTEADRCYVFRGLSISSSSRLVLSLACAYRACPIVGEEAGRERIQGERQRRVHEAQLWCRVQTLHPGHRSVTNTRTSILQQSCCLYVIRFLIRLVFCCARDLFVSMLNSWHFFLSGYINMTPPLHDLVVKDCDSALSLDPHYIKALNRRALALEGLGRLEESLRGELLTFSLQS